MKEGTIDGAGFTLDEVFSLVESDYPVKVVLVIDYSMGGDMLIGKKHVKHIEELRGKTIGYEGTVVGEYLLHRALQMSNLKRSAVKLINVKAYNWLTTFKPIFTTCIN